MPDGRRPEPGGWNRLLVEVKDVRSRVAELKQAGVRFRGEIVSGPGGTKILVEDPDGNPIELFEPTRAAQSGSRGCLTPSPHNTTNQCKSKSTQTTTLKEARD